MSQSRALLAALRLWFRLGRLRPWPGHRGVGLDAGDQRDRFVGAKRDVDLGCGFSHVLQPWWYEDAAIYIELLFWHFWPLTLVAFLDVHRLDS